MHEVQATILRGTFVVFEGQGTPDTLTTGSWWSWPTEVTSRDTVHAMQIMPPGTFRFHFFDLHLLPDDVAKYFQDGKLQRFLASGEARNRSEYHYVNCIPLTFEQVFEYRRLYSSARTSRPLLIPTAHFSLPPNSEHLVRWEKHVVVLGADLRGHLLTPNDKVLSIRAAYNGEFRMLCI